MTDVMAQQGYGLSVPNSRQDVISALLNEYSTSFGRGDGASALSPVPADKELPPPPRSDSLKNKPLPAVQRAEQRMSMKFQLRGKRISSRPGLEFWTSRGPVVALRFGSWSAHVLTVSAQRHSRYHLR
jgi:hypothetical protein